MTLIVEDGTKVANAESYCSVAQADSYHAGRSTADAWDAIDADVRERCLREATDYLTQQYSGRWAGLRANDDQALDWPRDNVPLQDSLQGYRPNNTIPVELVRACAELAIRVSSTPLLTDQGRETQSETVDSISVTYVAGSGRQTKYPTIDGWLRPLLSSGSGIAINRS
jgi:hypothetical protein